MKKHGERRKFRPEAGRGAPLAIELSALDAEYGPAGDEPVDRQAEGVAVLCIRGPLEHHANWFFASYEEILSSARDALADESTKALVLRIDSPGGDAAGMVESSRKLRALGAKYKKPIFAYADETAASAAYGLACAAQEIWLPEGGHVGSVGVIAEVVDATARYKKEGLNVALITTGARKGDGHPGKPFDDDVRAAMQGHVDQLGDLFFELVADARGTTPDAVASLQAAVFFGQDAVEEGLADGVASFDDFVGHVLSAIGLAQSAQISSPPATGSALTSPSAKEPSMSHLKALAKVEETKRALLGATDKTRVSALAAYTAAVEAASKYKKTVVEEEETEEEESEEDADSDEDAKKKSPPKMEDEEEEEEEEEEEDEDADDDADDDSDDDDGDADDDAKKAKAILGAKSGLHTHARLFRLCAQTARAITGKKKLSVAAIFAAIEGARRTAKTNAKLVARVANLENERTAEKVDAILAKATAEGRITPAQAKQFRPIGLQSVPQLKGTLATMPKRATRTLAQGEIPPNVDPNAYTAAMEGRSAAAQDIIRRTAARTGKSEAEVAAGLDADMKKNNGAALARY